MQPKVSIRVSIHHWCELEILNSEFGNKVNDKRVFYFFGELTYFQYKKSQYKHFPSVKWKSCHCAKIFF
jgi:hypothetical protein